jgi:peptide/nickel transport system substrate-binding protein
MIPISRRGLIRMSGAAALPLLGHSVLAASDASDTVTIASNVTLPSFDPTSGPSAVNPPLQSFYQSIFDPYVAQNPNLSWASGMLTKWGWNGDRTQISLELRTDAYWHNGDRVTPEDIIWSMQRAAKPDGGSPVQFIWSSLGNWKSDGKVITADVQRFVPDIFEWMGFLTGYALPKTYYEKVGPEGFENAPIGSGPYMVDQYERNAFLRLKANPKYWGGKPAFETVVFKFVPDATSRVAEIESGKSDVTLEVPYEEYDRLKNKAGLKGECKPISDIGMIFITNGGVMDDKNVRLAMCHSVDKATIIKKLLRGYGVPIDTLQAPDYEAYDPSIKVPYDPALATKLLAASGYSKDKPVKFTIQTTRGFKPKDYEMVQAIVGMWRNVGIDANIEIYEIAKHFELRMSHKLAPAAFYNCGNAIGDPSTSTGHAMFSKSPHSGWHSDDLDAMIGPLWGEKDEKKRIEGWKKVDRYIAEQGYVLPLLQYEQPILYKSDLKVIPNKTGALQPATLISKA